MEPLELTINPALDRAALRLEFRRQTRVRIPGFLGEAAAAWLARQLRERQDWVQVINSGAKVFELDRQVRKGMTPEQARSMDDAVYRGARTGFQYRYESIRVPDEPAARAKLDDPLARLAEWMSVGEGGVFVRAVTGFQQIAFADAQATAYAPGDFLTAHDDGVAGKNRLAAYVLGLTPGWRTEWGGLLLFHAADGMVTEGVMPEYNTLNIFAVPQQHSVSEVTRAAPHRRYSVTGWLRTSG